LLPIKDNIPTQRFPVVTVAIIGLNAAVWLIYERAQPTDQSVLQSAWFPCEVHGTCTAPGPGWPVDAFTSMFMHGSWLHILGNMLFLWIFGNNVEDRMGRIRFAIFYLAAGLAATALQTWVTLQWGTVQDSEVPNLGASGAIAGVLGAYFLLFPAARVLTFVIIIFIFTPFEVPAVVFLGIWFLFQLWDGGFDLLAPSGHGTGGVAFFAHIGGFLFGMLTVLLFRMRGPRKPVTPAWPRSEA
jgi:membrane associated rhomboid family serine protease